MRIGMPKETRAAERHVALVSAAAGELADAGYEVWREAGRDAPAGHAKEACARLGARSVPDAAALHASARLIVKARETVGDQIAHLRRDHLLFCCRAWRRMPDWPASSPTWA